VSAAVVALLVVAAGAGGWSMMQKRRVAADRNAAKNLNEMGFAKQEAGDQAGAESYYRQAIAKDRRYARPYNNLGLLAAGSGQTAEADSMFRLAIALDPRFSAALVNLGNLYVDATPESAEVFYGRALQGDEPAPAANQLGLVRRAPQCHRRQHPRCTASQSRQGRSRPGRLHLRPHPLEGSRCAPSQRRRAPISAEVAEASPN
jgi:Tfp pilus assembly protein PilF